MKRILLLSLVMIVPAIKSSQSAQDFKEKIKDLTAEEQATMASLGYYIEEKRAEQEKFIPNKERIKEMDDGITAAKAQLKIIRMKLKIIRMKLRELKEEYNLHMKDVMEIETWPDPMVIETWQ